MSDLDIDVPALQGAALTLRSAADAVPLEQAIDASGCGSPAVISAVDTFNLWARATGQIVAGRFRNSGDDADAAVAEYLRADDELAAGTN